MTAPSTPPPVPGTLVLGDNAKTQNDTGNVTVWDLPANLKGYDGPVWFDSTDTTIPVMGRGVAAKTPSYQNVTDIYNNIRALFYNHRDAFREVQADLMNASFYGSATSIPAGMTDATSNALGSALQQYISDAKNGISMSFRDWLKDRATANKEQAGPGTVPSSSSSGPTVSDPARIAVSANQVAQAFLGRSFTNDEMSKFVNIMQQNQEVQTGLTGSATLSAEAQQYAAQADPVGYQSHRAQGYVNALLTGLFGIDPKLAPQMETSPAPGMGQVAAQAAAPDATGTVSG